MPTDYQTSFQNWRYATVDDLGKAAKDWPDLNFIIYHSAIRPFFDVKATAAEFEQTGRIPWVSELAEIPSKYGVKNVYGEIGTSFASTVVTYPRLAAGMMGILVKGLGVDHVVWGSDSIWYGSPQWQIEALRRLEIPEDMQKKWGFAPLGPANGLVKRAIFGYNSAALYNLDLNARVGAVPPDFRDKRHAEGRVRAGGAGPQQRLLRLDPRAGVTGRLPPAFGKSGTDLSGPGTGRETAPFEGGAARYNLSVRPP
jgi:hypothetical protein